MKYIKIFDSYQSQKDLQQLCSAIFYRFAEEVYDTIDSPSDTIEYIPFITLKDFNPNWGTLSQFIIDYKDLRIAIVDADDLNKRTTGKAAYLTAKESDGKLTKHILLGDKDDYLIKKLNEIIKDDWGKDSKSIKNRMASVMYSDLKNSLIHELQHAYDDWRSKGKFDDTMSKDYLKKRDKFKEINSKTSELKEEEMDFIAKHHIDYLNLPFEVDARFTDAIARTSFYEYDLDKSLELEKDFHSMKPFNKVVKEFKSKMHGFLHLKDTEKRRVLRKLGQFYELEKEFVKKKNEEAIPYTESMNESVITPPNIPNTMNFWHGGNLDDYDDMIAQKNGRYEYGAGLYITTHYATAHKYSKGSRKLYLITVEKGLDINDATLDMKLVLEFIKTYVISSKRKEIVNRLEKYIKDGRVRASILNNIILNEKAIKSTNTRYLRQFYVDNGIDYEIVHNPFGWHEDMMVLYNMKKIVNTIRITSKDKIEVFNLKDNSNEE